MADVRLREEPFEFDGNTYMLRCNMNVLADMQELGGGDFENVLDGTIASALSVLTVMLNDYADEQGWAMVTRKTVGRRINLSEFKRFMPKMWALVTDALKDETNAQEKPEKN